MKGHTLLDGVVRNRQHPSTFRIPSDDKKQAIHVGEVVKLGFMTTHNNPEDLNERMWVIITELTKNGYLGKINNDPFSPSLADEQLVEFESRHILAIWKE